MLCSVTGTGNFWKMLVRGNKEAFSYQVCKRNSIDKPDISPIFRLQARKDNEQLHTLKQEKFSVFGNKGLGKSFSRALDLIQPHIFQKILKRNILGDLKL